MLCCRDFHQWKIRWPFLDLPLSEIDRHNNQQSLQSYFFAVNSLQLQVQRPWNCILKVMTNLEFYSSSKLWTLWNDFDWCCFILFIASNLEIWQPLPSRFSYSKEEMKVAIHSTKVVILRDFMGDRSWRKKRPYDIDTFMNETICWQ